MNVLSGLRKLLRSPAVASAAAFALGGVGFAVGNVLLAGALPPIEYGYVALFLSFTQLASAVGGMGMETIVNRHLLGASAWLLRRVLMTSVLIGVVLAALAQLFYEFNLA